MRLFIALAALLLAGQSFAQNCPVAPADPVPRDAVRLNWVRPTANTDGTAIPAATVITYSLYERSGTTDTVRCTTANVSAGQSGLTVGAHTWVVSAKVGTGPESAKSNTASKTIQAPTPNPPANLTADPGDLTAWTVVTTDGAIVALEVGKVAPGTACNPDQYVKAFGRAEVLYEVPVPAVAFLPNQTAIVTFASCGG